MLLSLLLENVICYNKRKKNTGNDNKTKWKWNVISQIKKGKKLEMKTRVKKCPSFLFSYHSNKKINNLKNF